MPKAPIVHVCDFETFPIQGRPEYPPRPVGVSIQMAGEKKGRYYSWGHPTENNCDKAEAVRALKLVWASKEPVLFHHAKFDVDVAQTHMDCGDISWDRIHDTMLLLFLQDPHEDLGLKPAAHRILGMPPEEQDAVAAWVLAHKKQVDVELLALAGYGEDGKPKLKITPSRTGAGIYLAPGKLVGTYANGDVERTLKLFKKVYPEIVDRGMLAAYDRERELMPILLENERVGMRVDLAGLRRDIGIYQQAMDAADVWLRKRLKSPNLNLDNDNEVAEALASAGVVDDEAWTLTKTGKRSVSKKNLLTDMYNDAKVAQVFGYRNRLTTCLKMFMLPWERQAGGRKDQHVSTNWNQVKQDAGGTRTGRPSTSNPNFLNISKTWDDKDDGYLHPTFIKALPQLPLVRSYILPDKGGVFCHRDFNGQELRILGHYENGALMEAYQADPSMDVHGFVRQLIEDIAGLKYHRTQVKITNFRRIYGGGAPATAGALNVSIEVAKQLLEAHGKALPGVKDLGDTIKATVKRGEPITTWGGREYYVEPPKYDERFKRHMTYEYKLLNYLIQGSAADATKQAILNYHNHPDRKGRFMVTVYDEINSSCPKAHAKREMAVLKECMEDLAFDVPMITDGKTGPSWSLLQKYKDAA